MVLANSFPFLLEKVEKTAIANPLGFAMAGILIVVMRFAFP